MVGVSAFHSGRETAAFSRREESAATRERSRFGCVQLRQRLRCAAAVGHPVQPTRTGRREHDRPVPTPRGTPRGSTASQIVCGVRLTTEPCVASRRQRSRSISNPATRTDTPLLRCPPPPGRQRLERPKRQHGLPVATGNHREVCPIRRDGATAHVVVQHQSAAARIVDRKLNQRSLVHSLLDRSAAPRHR